MDEENRLKITLWLKPGIVRRMDGWLEEDNCKSRGEFAEKALRFYMGYLATEDTSEYDHLRLNRSSHEYKRIKNVVSLMPPYAPHCVHIRRTLRRLHRKE